MGIGQESRKEEGSSEKRLSTSLCTLLNFLHFLMGLKCSSLSVDVDSNMFHLQARLLPSALDSFIQLFSQHLNLQV